MSFISEVCFVSDLLPPQAAKVFDAIKSLSDEHGAVAYSAIHQHTNVSLSHCFYAVRLLERKRFIRVIRSADGRLSPNRYKVLRHDGE